MENKNFKFVMRQDERNGKFICELYSGDAFDFLVDDDGNFYIESQANTEAEAKHECGWKLTKMICELQGLVDELQEIKKRGYIIVGVKSDSPPFGFYKDKKLSGIDIDVKPD